jgi:predicted transcriptional regulator
MTEHTPASERLAALTAQVVAAYVGRNDTSLADVPQLMATVYQSLSKLGHGGPLDGNMKPAVNPKKSVFPDFIVCLEDGKKLKMLKRHLKTAYNLTPEQYRERWSLAADYPMTAPNYAKRRSKLAKQIGLGTSPRKALKKAA